MTKQEEILKKHLVGLFDSEQQYDDWISRVDPEVYKAMDEYAASLQGQQGMRGWVDVDKGMPPNGTKALTEFYGGDIRYYEWLDVNKEWHKRNVKRWLDQSAPQQGEDGSHNDYQLPGHDETMRNLDNLTIMPKKEVVCPACSSKSIKENKIDIEVGDKRGSWASVVFQYCDDCGHRQEISWFN